MNLVDLGRNSLNMKIAFDYQIFAMQRYGGISRYFFELAKNIPLVKNSNSVASVTAPFYVNEYLRNGADEIPVFGTYVPKIPFTGKLVRGVNASLSPIILNHFDPDILHETYYSKNSKPTQNPRRVVTVHDMIHELFPESFSTHDKTRELKKDSISRAEHVVCVSESTRQDLVRILNVDPKKTSVVHLGCSLSARSRQSRADNKRPYLLYVGSRDGYKNFSSFIEAYARSAMLRPNFDVLAVGGGAFKPHEKLLFQKLKISPGGINQLSGDDALLESCYRDAALFVFPSLYEGFGIPTLEAMSYGCPVACSNTSSIPEVVGNAAVFFDPYSIESIINSLESALFGSGLRETMIQRGFDRIQKFSWGKCAEETLRVYERVLQ